MRKSNKQKRLLLSAADIKKELAKPNVDFAKKFLNDFIVVLKFIKRYNPRMSASRITARWADELGVKVLNRVAGKTKLTNEFLSLFREGMAEKNNPYFYPNLFEKKLKKNWWNLFKKKDDQLCMFFFNNYEKGGSIPARLRKAKRIVISNKLKETSFGEPEISLKNKCAGFC